MKTEEKAFTETEIENEKQEVIKLNFRQAIAQLPEVLMTIVLKRFGLAAAALVITLVMFFITKDWYCFGGLILSLMAVYLGLDIIWKFGDDKIMVARIIVCKVYRRRKGQLHVIIRDANVQDIVKEDFETFRVVINANIKDRDNIIPGTVMNIFFTENAPGTVLTYEILGDTNI